MDASSRRILGLLSETNVCLVVPVYQRPYSWDEEQCVQLWDDVLRCGRESGGAHFTGSIVTIQDGTPCDDGVASLLLIDGQQRLATVALLMVALARHAAAHPDAALPFSRDEIVRGGYLTNPFREGAHHYKLALSKDDRIPFQALVDGLEQGTEPAIDGPSRLLDNLALFERRLAPLHDVGSVWRGLQRLEVVMIALTQGTDEPQAIFESMNSTGKDLSSADLVRNFVLMGQPVSEQREMYDTYWHPIERELGGTALDEAFDGFVRCYLAVAHAPSSFVDADLYRAFKRHVLMGGHATADRMRMLCLRLRRFARYYACVTRGSSDDAQFARALGRIRRLGVACARPLVVSLLDGYDRRLLEHDELLAMLGVVESYLLRRAVCDGATSVLPSLFSSLVARLGAVLAEGGDCADALAAMLLGERDTSRRFPTDAEFAHALRTRDMYDCALAPYLLARLEGACGGADDVDPIGAIVERVLPPRALASSEWRSVLGDDPEHAFHEGVNNLGNLVLTAFDFELQDATFVEKRARLDGPADVTPVIAQDVIGAGTWDAQAIARRAARLADVAVRVWPMPTATEQACRMYRAVGRAAWTDTVTFADLFDAGLVRMDDRLVSASPLYPGRASVTSRGRIMLADGQGFDDPTEAFAGLLAALGASPDGLDGWLYWRLGEGGPLLDDLRAKLL